MCVCVGGGRGTTLVLVTQIASYSANAECSVVFIYSEYSRITFSGHLYSSILGMFRNVGYISKFFF